MVGLRAGEVEKRSPEALLGDHPQVHLQAGAEHHRGPSFPLRNHPPNVLVLDELFDDLPALFGSDHNVEVPDRLLPPPVASCHDGFVHALDPIEVYLKRFSDLLGYGKLDPLLGGAALLDGLQDVLLRLLSETGKLAYLAVAGVLLQLPQATDTEPLMQLSDALAAQTGQSQQLAQSRVGTLLQLLRLRKLAGLDDLLDLAGKILSDSG